MISRICLLFSLKFWKSPITWQHDYLLPPPNQRIKIQGKASFYFLQCWSLHLHQSVVSIVLLCSGESTYCVLLSINKTRKWSSQCIGTMLSIEWRWLSYQFIRNAWIQHRFKFELVFQKIKSFLSFLSSLKWKRLSMHQ